MCWGVLGRSLVFISAAAVVAAMTNANINFAGSYGTDDAWITLALALFLVIGAGYCGWLWIEHRWFMAAIVTVGLMAGEGYWLFKNAKRELATSAQLAAPVTKAAMLREAATKRVKAAELVKWTADKTAAEKSAERYCKSNCKDMLLTAQARADAELDEARADLAALPVPLSTTQMADHLGVKPWAWDLAIAGLRSVVIAAASLVAGLVVHHRPKPIRVPARAVVVNGRRHAAEFLSDALHPSPGREASICRLYDLYLDWCREQNIQPLKAEQIGEHLEAVIVSHGYEYAPVHDDFILKGAELVSTPTQKSGLPTLLTDMTPKHRGASH